MTGNKHRYRFLVLLNSSNRTSEHRRAYLSRSVPAAAKLPSMWCRLLCDRWGT